MKHFLPLFRFLFVSLLLLILNACAGNNDEDPLQSDIGMGGGTLGNDTGTLPGGEFIDIDGLPPRDPMGVPVEGAYAPVYFGYDSSSVAPSEMSKVQQIADALSSNARYTLIIQGHTDERGSREYNLALGERRALAVRELLISFGVDGSRIQTLSFGEEQPAVAGFEESAYSMNRRAEFQLMQ